jgi:hypothetical protein
MAKRKQLWHPDEVRQRIQASQLINRLTDNALSTTPLMDASQVASARILLSKVLPDLSQAEVKTETTVRYVARIPDKATTADTWQQQHDPHATTH